MHFRLQKAQKLLVTVNFNLRINNLLTSLAATSLKLSTYVFDKVLLMQNLINDNKSKYSPEN